MKQVREPVAWALLAAAGVNVVVGLVDALSNSWSLASLGLLGGAGNSGAGFTERALAGRGDVASVGAAVLPVVAVILAALAGEKVTRAIQIARAATVLQGIALLLGVVYWLAALGAHVDGAVKAKFFVQGLAGLAVSAAGLFFLVKVLRSPEMQPESSGKPAAYPGFGYPRQPPPDRYQAGYGTDRDTAVLAVPAAQAGQAPPAGQHGAMAQQAPAQAVAQQAAAQQAAAQQSVAQQSVAPQVPSPLAAAQRAAMQQVAAQQAAQRSAGREAASQQAGAHGYGRYSHAGQGSQLQGYSPSYQPGYQQPSYSQQPAPGQQQAGQQAYGQRSPLGNDEREQQGAQPQAGGHGSEAYAQGGHSQPEYRQGGYGQPGYGHGGSRPRAYTQPGYGQGGDYGQGGSYGQGGYQQPPPGQQAYGQRPAQDPAAESGRPGQLGAGTGQRGSGDQAYETYPQSASGQQARYGGEIPAGARPGVFGQAGRSPETQERGYGLQQDTERGQRAADEQPHAFGQQSRVGSYEQYYQQARQLLASYEASTTATMSNFHPDGGVGQGHFPDVGQGVPGDENYSHQAPYEAGGGHQAGGRGPQGATGDTAEGQPGR